MLVDSFFIGAYYTDDTDHTLLKMLVDSFFIGAYYTDDTDHTDDTYY